MLPISGVLPNFRATWHTCVNQIIFSPVRAFNILGLISSSPGAFLNFIPLIAVATFVAVKTSSYPKRVTLCVSRVDALQNAKDLLSILSIVKGFYFYPFECYLQNPWRSTWHRIFCHVNGGWSAKILCLPKTIWNPTDDQTLPITST